MKMQILGSVLFILLSTPTLFAQIVTLSNQVNELEIPTDGSVTSFYIEIKGGDGGNARAGNCRGYGGDGAMVRAHFEVGAEDGQIPPGATLRFVRGYKGGSQSSDVQLGAMTAGGGGGGGSALLYREAGKTSESDWKILAVAGGGGGAYSDVYAWTCLNEENGKGGSRLTSGGDGLNSGSGSTSGGRDQAGGSSVGYMLNIKGSSGGAGALGSTTFNTKAGYPAGGSGGKVKDGQPGGFGFGGGGASYYGGGGGGGYSGGGAGDSGGGGGGGSYVHPDSRAAVIVSGKDGAGHATDGYLKYQLNPAQEDLAFLFKKTIKWAADPAKCLEVQSGQTANGTNIQINNCNDSDAQNWIFDGQVIRLAKDLNKCLDLDHSNTSNGANIQLWGCNDSDAQKWTYDGITQQIRSRLNAEKCIDLKNGTPSYQNNIQLLDCKQTAAQIWVIDEATLAEADATVKTIRSFHHTASCLDITGSKNADGTNIQLWKCGGSDGNSGQQWYFDGLQIKWNRFPDKCLDLDHSNITEGTNIQLYSCNGTDAQKWIYDAVNRSIRSVVHQDRCIDVKDGQTANGTNIQISNCLHNVSGQLFYIDTAPCLGDTQAPVAKCKDVQYTLLQAPDPEDLDNGSYDNCAISSRILEKISGNVFRLIVEDASGNSASCTASVSFQ